MKLTYWIAKCNDDSDCYSMRARTKKECTKMYNEVIENTDADYDKPKKVTVEYSDGFDLMIQCSCESRHYWEV